MKQMMKRIYGFMLMLMMLVVFAIPAFAAPDIDGAKLLVHTNENGTPMDGVSYELLNFNGVLMTFTKLQDGEYSMGGAITEFEGKNGCVMLYGIIEGTYTVRQKKVAANYEKSNPESKSVYLNHNSTVNSYFSITKKEPPTPTPTPNPTPNPVEKNTSRFYVKDTNEKTLPSVHFGVYNGSNEKVSEVISDSTGYMTSTSLPYGGYTLKVISGNGYKLKDNKDTYGFVVSNKDELHVVIMETKKGKIRLNVDDDKGQPVKDVEYTLYDSNDKKIGDVKTDEKGKGLFEEVEAGKYYVQSKDILRNATKHPVTIIESEQAEIYIKDSNIKRQGTIIASYKAIDDNREVSASVNYTDEIGSDFMNWLTRNGHDKKALDGFVYVKTDYPAETKLIDGTLYITYWYTGKQEEAPKTIVAENVDEGTEELEVVENNDDAEIDEPVIGTRPATTQEQDEEYIPEEPTDFDRTPVPQTGDPTLNLTIPLALTGVVAALGCFIIRKRFMKQA